VLEIGVVVDYVHGTGKNAETCESKTGSHEHFKVEEIQGKYENGKDNQILDPLCRPHRLNQSYPASLPLAGQGNVFDLLIQNKCPPSQSQWIIEFSSVPLPIL
jgi:hypothetical protein